MIHVVTLDTTGSDPHAAAVLVITLDRYDEIAALVLFEVHPVRPHLGVIL
jgi:hypothetical protein